MRNINLNKTILCYIVLVLLSSVLVLTGCQSSREIKAEKSYNAYFDAISNMKKEKYNEAISDFETVIKNKVPELKLSSKDKKIINSKDQLQYYIRSFYYKAQLLEKLGSNSEALEEYKNAIKADTKNYKVERKLDSTDYLKRSMAYIKLEEYDKALVEIDNGLNTSDNIATKDLLYNKIMLCEKNNDWLKAKETFNEYKSKYEVDESLKDDERFLETR